MDWREAREARSIAVIGELSREHPGYSIEALQPNYRGGTNLITMGLCGAEPIVFKYFEAPDRYRNELFCLNHFAATGWVPRVLHVIPDKLIAMSRLPSDDRGLHQLSANEVAPLSNEIGAALACLAKVPLHRTDGGYWPVTDFTAILWGRSPRESINVYLERCRRIHAGMPEYATPLFTASLRLIETQLDAIAAQPEILWHEDIGNLAVNHGRLTGFYDLEMCRGGTEAMQLGVAIRLCLIGLSWPALLRGYESKIGHPLSPSDLLSVLAMHHFYCWIRVCHWGWWDGDPANQERRTTALELVQWAGDEMRAGCRLIQEQTALPDYFSAAP